MARDRMQKQRFELKYIIDEETALKVRDFVTCYLEMDEYSVGRANFSYEVHSLYVDSDDLRLYWETINGNKNRYKLRLRYYSTNPDAPVFFEIKRRMNNCIMKQRGGVRHDAIGLLLNGHLPEERHVLAKSPKNLVAVQNFCHLLHDIQGKPRVHIAYLREAYLSSDDTVRVTMDREIKAEENLQSSIKTHMNRPAHSFQRQVILELKFTNRHPNWFRELVRVFNVMQCGAAKYVSSIERLGSQRLGATTPVMNEGHDLTNIF
jgi:SPX domain protein involved in polyphosphate accumulation